MMDFRQNTIDDSIDTFGEDNTARELKPKSFKKEVKKEVKKAKRKMQKSRPRREVSDKELIRKPDYDLRTLERRFCQLKINKLANRVYNREIAKNHRILCSELNKKVLNDVKERIEMKKGRPDRKDCGYCKSYKLKDVRFPMEKVKPLFDDIWIRRPQNENDYKEIEEKNKEIAELQAVVTKIETQEMIQRSINQILYSRINPGAGMMPTY